MTAPLEEEGREEEEKKTAEKDKRRGRIRQVDRLTDQFLTPNQT